MKVAGIAIAIATLGLAGCGGSDAETNPTQRAAGSHERSDPVAGKLPAGAVAPVDRSEQTEEGPAAAEASPESPAEGPESTGELEGADRSAATAAVRSYIASLDRRDARRVCVLIERGGCHARLGARPSGGGPAWRRTQIVEMKPEALGDDRARVTTTVTHRFSDRKYVSVEDDVIYLERVDGRWLLAQPSATFYRAVGYAEPPLRAFAPPPGW
jgi:hypothetical protein